MPSCGVSQRGNMYNPHHWYEYGMLRSPGLLRVALEWRVLWEYGAALATQPLLRRGPKGDGHPVMVFPGLVASDLSTQPLRQFLESLGYAAYPWEHGRNVGPREGLLDACLARLKALRKQHRKKVSLIGWSLGGQWVQVPVDRLDVQADRHWGGVGAISVVVTFPAGTTPPRTVVVR